jgi:uncharacterized damage-inducible protein DinB
MMNQQSLAMLWDHVRQVQGTVLRGVEAIPDDKLDSHPIPNMRTPKELVVHVYSMVLRAVAEGAASGSIKDDAEKNEKATAASLTSKGALIQYCRDNWAAADAAIKKVTDEKLNAIVATPWGMSMPGFVCVQVISDELLHHRGQLWAYLRAMGTGEPPFLWSFDKNHAEFQPNAAQTA